MCFWYSKQTCKSMVSWRILTSKLFKHAHVVSCSYVMYLTLLSMPWMLPYRSPFDMFLRAEDLKLARLARHLKDSVSRLSCHLQRFLQKQTWCLFFLDFVHNKRPTSQTKGPEITLPIFVPENRKATHFPESNSGTRLELVVPLKTRGNMHEPRTITWSMMDLRDRNSGIVHQFEPCLHPGLLFSFGGLTWTRRIPIL